MKPTKITITSKRDGQTSVSVHRNGKAAKACFPSMEQALADVQNKANHLVPTWVNGNRTIINAWGQGGAKDNE
jgi:hypothetical protein